MLGKSKSISTSAFSFVDDHIRVKNQVSSPTLSVSCFATHVYFVEICLGQCFVYDEHFLYSIDRYRNIDIVYLNILYISVEMLSALLLIFLLVLDLRYDS